MPLELATAQASIVVVGRVEAGEAPDTVNLAPEAFLKGPASSQPLTLRPGWSGCIAALAPGSRLVVFLREDETWPGAGDIYALEEGRAITLVGTDVGAEDEFLGRVRDITEQFAVPAANESEGEGIEWATTVLPIAVALGIVFVIGLFLMRIWHRIDPS
ncbi:MAG: hypothetical protein ACRDHF_01295 [Tepidiformaceae bacterium]